MRHEDEQWKKEIRKEPFATSPFTEDHKRNVLQQVDWMKNSEEGKLGGRSERSSMPSRPQVGSFRAKRRRLRRGPLVAGAGALAITAGLFLWIWNDGQLVKPVIEQVYPIAALQFSNNLSIDLLTDKMKRNVAVTMRDDLGKQLKITNVQDLPVSGRVYVEAGNEHEEDYAEIWLDATTGNLREVQMRRKMQPRELEHRYMRQIPSLLQSIGSDPTLKPELIRRSVGMKQGETQPVSHTVLTLGDEINYGEIVWQQDKAVSITGELRADQVSQTALKSARHAVEALSGKPDNALEGVSRTKDDELGKDTVFFSFENNYFVQMTEGKEGLGYTVGDTNHYEEQDIGNIEEMEAYHEKLFNIDESLLRDQAGPIVKKIFNIDFSNYQLHRDVEALGMVTFELESSTDVFQVQYKEDGRITMITRGEY
ncbi:hypothetical protein C0Q44_02230 [Paenibacillus sp. PCH8]|uniref:hypothetical protein n=1 Tax=Paenibacillus sp. PCH8 TaxID=2066524 RepID=UPI000CF91E79|nr:hypothetical protein [Paenibacillus sp. PCH8]PQP83547.1 hypothetical protein C0Q44_02230 [Paenibacillus sp. PCH8]